MEVSDGALQKLHGHHDKASLVGQCHENQSYELGRGKSGDGDSQGSPQELARGRGMSEYPSANTPALAPNYPLNRKEMLKASAAMCKHP